MIMVVGVGMVTTTEEAAAAAVYIFLSLFSHTLKPRSFGGVEAEMEVCSRWRG